MVHFMRRIREQFSGCSRVRNTREGNMSIARSVQEELSRQGLEYDVVTHPPTSHSQQTAESAHIPGDKLAKGVVVGDAEGPMLAVIPASRSLDVDRLNELLGRHLALMPEQELSQLFADCELGAVPATGTAYDLPTIADAQLLHEDEVWFEAGDHRTLLHLSGDAFRRLMSAADSGTISRPD
jgi:Ala-tRNA(Pro) deacylase